MIETLLKIDLPLDVDYQYLPEEQGVYFAKFTKDSQGYGPYYSQWTSDSINELNYVIGSVFVDTALYNKKTSLSDCIYDDASFFWDNGAQTLYIHFEFDKIPETSTIEYGIEQGYSFIGTGETFYINDVKFEPRILSTPTIKKAVDKFQAGKMRFRDLSVTLKNGDGELDDFIQQPVPGAEASIVLYDTETLTELEYYTGFVVGDESTYDEYKINIEDKRRRENLKVPRTRFSTDDYADIESKYVGKTIPEGYGDVVRIKAFPTNGDESPTPTNISYKYATDATTLTKVEVEEDDVWADVTSSVLNSVPSTGSFDLPYATATNASGGLLPCVVTATLRDEENPGDIIADMNDRYNSVNFDSSSYDLTEWASEKAKLSDVALYMAKDKEFFKWVEDLQNGTQLWFVYDIDGSGKRTLRVNDPNRAKARDIRYEDIKDDKKTVGRDFTEFSSTVAVLYNQDYEDEVYERIDVDTYEAEVIATYRTPADSEFESLLVAEVDAQTKADEIAEDQREARPVVKVTLHGDDLDDLDLKLYDIVTVDLSRPNVTYFEPPNDTMTADYNGSDTMTADYNGSDSMYATYGQTVIDNSYPDEREYWGTIRGQVLGIDYNPANLDYTLTIRERPV